jgi:hypothetical protein
MISGIPDSVIYGSSVIDQIGKRRAFYIFRKREKIKTEFYLVAKMTQEEVIKN